MKSSWGHQSAQNAEPDRKRQWIIAAIVLLLLILLLAFAPMALMILSIPAFIIALIALAIGRLRWAGVHNRRVAGALVGGLLVVYTVSAFVAAGRLPATMADRVPVAAIPTPTATVESPPVTLVGQTCDADDLTETEGSESIYCDDDGTGSLYWVSAADHEVAERQAAAEKAAADKNAAEKAAAEKKATAEKKAAEEAAAEKRAAEKAAAEKMAAEKAAAERAAAAGRKAAAERAAAEQAAADKAAAAKIEAEQAARPKAQAPAAQSGGTDPRFSTCADAKAAGYGPYVSGVNPEYNWYRDQDKDGVNCEP